MTTRTFHTAVSTYGVLTFEPTARDAEGSHKMLGSTLGSASDLIALLGEPNREDDPEKVAYCWGGNLVWDDGRRVPVMLWDWKGSSEHGQWSLWSGGGIADCRAWDAYLRDAIAQVRDEPKGWRSTT